jgi:hypothetical protein
MPNSSSNSPEKLAADTAVAPAVAGDSLAASLARAAPTPAPALVAVRNVLTSIIISSP